MNLQPPAVAAPDLAALLVQRGCDPRAVERGRRVAGESGQRLDSVLLQLGLVSERDIAEAFAELLQAAVVPPSRYPGTAARRRGRDRPALSARRPHAAARGGGRRAAFWPRPIPLDRFTADRRRRRHRPAGAHRSRGADRTGGGARPACIPPRTPAEDRAGDEAGGDPLEEDAERLKDLASEAPVIRLVNQLIARAVETQASDIHIEPFEDRAARALPLRRRAARGGKPAAAPGRGDHLAHQDHGAARHRRAPAAAGRPHPPGGARPGRGFPRLHRPLAARRDGGAARARPHRRGVRLRPARPVARAWWRSCQQALRPAQRHRAGDRPDRQRQDHDALYRPAGAQFGRPARSSPSRTRSSTSCAASTRSRSSRRSA